MARKPSSPKHQWINACTLKADDRTAAIGNRLGRVTIEHEPNAAKVAGQAIGLFLEYRQSHGYDEDDAKDAAVAEVAEGTRATDTVVDVIDVYCSACRRTYDDVVGQPCAVAVSNQHLIGGATGTRKRRVHDHDCHLFGCILTEAEAAELRRAAANPPRHRVG